LALSALSSLLLCCGAEFKAGDGSGGGGGDAGRGGSAGNVGAGGSKAGSGGAGGTSHAGRGSTAGSSGSGATGGVATGGVGADGGSGGSQPGVAGTSTGGSNMGGVAGSAGSGGSPPVEPDIPKEGLELWLRADHGVEGGEQVAIWRDGSGHGRDAIQTAVNYRPRLVEGALGGKAALQFDGTDDFLKLAPLSADFAAGVTFFVVLEHSAGDACQTYFEASNGPEIDDLHFGTYQNSLLLEVAADWVNDVSYPLLTDAPQIAVGMLDADALVHLRSNGNGAGEGHAGLPLETTREHVFIGHTLYADCTRLKATVGEMLLYSRAVSDSELLEIEGYLQEKWSCCQP
jgi:hypothetical protein